MGAEERLVEIRDLLAQMLQQSREDAKRRDDIRAEYLAALASQRRLRTVLLAIIVPLVGGLFYIALR